jgi:transposase
VFIERACVGLDVRARSIVACVMDNEAGEIKTLRLSPKTDAVVGWVASLPGPVAVTYEAGPTGFGVARALETAGVRCVVVASSKLERPPGDRVKTDRRDAERLARLLWIGELPGVRVPSEDEESARDLVRAGEDVRGDLMRARHRLSKLLLRQGLLWENSAWTGAHEAWLRAVRFERVGVGLVFDEAFDTVLATRARRDRLDAITEMPRQGAVRADRGAAGLSARDQYPDRVRAGHRDRRRAPVHRFLDRRVPGPGTSGVLQR